MSQELLTCTLGYHSQTQWLVEPQIVLLYDKVEMNRSIYDMIIDRGYKQLSTLDILLYRLLLEYESEGIIAVEDYDKQVVVQDRELVEELVAYWEKDFPDEFRSLAIEFLGARQAHLKRKRKFLDVAEPMYREITQEIEVRNDRIRSLRHGEIPTYAREGVKHGIEHVLFTERVRGGQLPVFEWYGYVKIREWLLSIPSFPTHMMPIVQEQQIDPSITEAETLDALIDLFVGSVEVSDEKQLKKILEQRKRLQAARHEVKEINKQIWTFVSSRDNLQSQELVEEFRQILKERVERLQEEYERVTLERKAALAQPLVRVVTGFSSVGISLLSLVLPVPGIAEKISDKLVQLVTHNVVDKKHPQLAWMYIFQEFGHLYEGSLLKRSGSHLKVARIRRPSDIELRESDFCALLGIDRSTLYYWLDKGQLPLPTRSWQGWEVYSSKHIKLARRLIDAKRT